MPQKQNHDGERTRCVDKVNKQAYFHFDWQLCESLPGHDGDEKDVDCQSDNSIAPNANQLAHKRRLLQLVLHRIVIIKFFSHYLI